MAIQLIVAKVLRDEASAIGIRSKRITQLELAARDFRSMRRLDKPT